MRCSWELGQAPWEVSALSLVAYVCIRNDPPIRVSDKCSLSLHPGSSPGGPLTPIVASGSLGKVLVINNLPLTWNQLIICVDYPTLVIGTNLTLMQPLHASAPTRAILAQATLCRWCLESRWLSQPAEPMCMWLLRLLCIL